MATWEYFGLESLSQFESDALVQRVVSLLRSEGSDPWSIGALSESLDISERGLQREFGKEEALVDAVWELWPRIVLVALSEPLRTAATGQEAVRGLLETAISLQSGYWQLKELRNANRPAGFERRSEQQTGSICGRALEYQIRDRLKRSVYEGELPESSNVLSLSALCFRLVNGFLAGAEDEVFTATALDSVKLFVDGLGFHVARPSKKRQRGLRAVLQFVKKPPGL